MNDETLANRLEFIRETGRLKDVLRSAHTIKGSRESTAEHTWRLCLWIIVFADAFPEIDQLKLLKLCIIHDLGEAISGDIPAIHQTADMNKSEQERRDLVTLLGNADVKVRSEILELWEEYEEASSPEAILAKGFDKLETLMTHNQGKNPDDFDYAFNLHYGKKATERNKLLSAIRNLLDRETKQHAQDSGQIA